MKRRDFREFNESLITDLEAFLEQHPDTIDAILYKANYGHPETVAAMDDVVGSIEDQERSIEYLDPQLTRMFILPRDYPLIADDEGAGPDGNMDQPIAVLIADPSVPKQSIIQYEEYISGSSEIRAVTLYVVRSEMFGEAGMKHYCIPFQAFDLEFIEAPINESPDNGATDVELTPTLTAGAFCVHGTEDTHGKSQWQIRGIGGTFDDPMYDSGEVADLTSHVVPADTLAPANAVYFWRVRYRGAAGDEDGETAIWSDWSEETGFTTVEE